MPIFSKNSGLLAAGLATVVLTACGGEKTKSSAVSIEIDPEQPIVITADTDTRKAPWFEFRMKVTNGSDASLKLIAVSAELEYIDGNGTAISGEKAWSPDEANAKQSNDSRICTYEDFGTFAPNDSDYLSSTNTSGEAGCPTVNPVFVMDAAPKSKNMKNYRYRVKAIPQGWFINSDGSLDRFTRFKVFTTR